MSDLLPPPFVLGLPDKYTEWRNRQDEAVMAAVDADSRFTMLCCPTGFGKSLSYMASALLEGQRVAFLTSTKGLQDQLIKDFAAVGLVDVRGMNSYQCIAAKDFGLAERTACNEAPCTAGAKCPLRDDGCLYYDAVRRALGSRLMVTNYSYWFHSNRHGEGLGNFGLLVCDEAHNLPSELSRFMQISFNPNVVEELVPDLRWPPYDASQKRWRDWGVIAYAKAKAIVSGLQGQVQDALSHGRPIPHTRMKKAVRLKRLMGELEQVANLQGEWATEYKGGRYEFEPVWPAPYAEAYLFRAIPKVVLYSATIRPKTASLLGIQREQLTFREFPSTFSLKRRPVIHVDTVNVKHNMPAGDIDVWANRIDQIIRRRPDRKGIVHVTSFARRDLLLSRTEFRSRILYHSSDNTAEVVEKFRRSSPTQGLVLVSPSLTTGWDFPGDQCRYQVIAKVPFPDFTTEVSKARDVSDPDWSRYEAMQTIVQTTGRGMRSEDDWCETICVDDNIAWFVRKFHTFAPKWWLDSFQSTMTLPAPLKG